MKKLNRPLAVWEKRTDEPYRKLPNGLYGFPLTDQWDDPAAPPLLDDRVWQFKCLLPVGVIVSDVVAEEGHRVRCKVTGVPMRTADFAISDAP